MKRFRKEAYWFFKMFKEILLSIPLVHVFKSLHNWETLEEKLLYWLERMSTSSLRSELIGGSTIWELIHSLTFESSLRLSLFFTSTISLLNFYLVLSFSSNSRPLLFPFSSFFLLSLSSFFSFDISTSTLFSTKVELMS